MPTAPAGSELETFDDGTDEDESVPLTPLCEQPVTADKHAAAATIPHCRVSGRLQRTASIYATLSGVMERFGFCECCRP